MAGVTEQPIHRPGPVVAVERPGVGPTGSEPAAAPEEEDHRAEDREHHGEDEPECDRRALAGEVRF